MTTPPILHGTTLLAMLGTAASFVCFIVAFAAVYMLVAEVHLTYKNTGRLGYYAMGGVLAITISGLFFLVVLIGLVSYLLHNPL